MLQTSSVSPQVSSFILNTRIPDSDIPLAFFGLRTVQEIHCQPDECHLNKLSPELLEFIARKLSFSDFVNFSATHTRNLSCLRSDFLINKIFDSDESVQELLLLKDLLKRAENFRLEQWYYQPYNLLVPKCPNRVFDEGPGLLKFQLSTEFNDTNGRNLSNTCIHSIFSIFVRDLYSFAKDESVNLSWRAFCCDRIVKINNECDIEGGQLGANIANIFLKYARVAGDQADNGEVRRKLTNLFEFMMKKPSKIELNNFIQESMS